MELRGPLRVGVGGPVGSGKTALVERLCKKMRDAYDIAIPPDKPAFSSCAKIIGRKFELDRQDVRQLQSDAGAGVGHIADATRKSADACKKNSDAFRLICVRPIKRRSLFLG